MLKLLSNPFVLALITAVVTSGLGYLINQLPEIPNKQHNTGWIIISVVVATLIVWIVAVLQNQQSSPKKRTVVTDNELRGKGNKLQVSQLDVDVSRNVIIGENQELSVDNKTEPPGPSSRGTL